MPRDVSEAFFDPQRVIDTLTRHGVRYVLIGGVAGRLHGSPLLTEDIDLVPDLAPANLAALAAALRELGARLAAEGVDGGVEIPLDEHTFTSPVMGFETEAGAIDVAREAIGRGGFAALVQRAVAFDIAGTRVLAAALDDVIGSKASAGRPKDLAELVVLRELSEELARREAEGW